MANATAAHDRSTKRSSSVLFGFARAPRVPSCCAMSPSTAALSFTAMGMRSETTETSSSSDEMSDMASPLAERALDAKAEDVGIDESVRGNQDERLGRTVWSRESETVAGFMNSEGTMLTNVRRFSASSQAAEAAALMSSLLGYSER